MANDNSQPSTSDSISGLAVDKVQHLIFGVAKIADSRVGLGKCRTEIVSLLIELTGAKGGQWAWGIADDSASSISPIATVEVGLTETESAAIAKTGLDPTMMEELRIPVMKRMNGRTQFTVIRTDMFDDQQWKTKRMYSNLRRGDLEEWLHSVRLPCSGSWSCIWLVRRTGDAPFQSSDRQLIDLAMSSIPWLGATLDVSLPAKSCVELTSRQSIVLMMQLAGLSRKQIASRLEITVDTVGDHMKQIYENFDVNSAGELAAIFLRER